jgi:large subunit ribosomal protein L33
MAGKKKLGAQLVRLLSQAGTGYFYVKKRNPKKNPVKLEMMKYDPVVRRHVLFREQKMK